MPLIKRFPSPSAALAWHYFHVYRWFFPLGTVFAVYLGHVHAAGTSGNEFGAIPTLICAIMIAVALNEHGSSSFQLRTPASTIRVVCCEMAVTALLLFWLWLCHAAAVAYSANGSVPEFFPLLKHVAFGLLALTFAKQRGALEYRLLVLWFLVLLAIFTYVLFLLADAISAQLSMVLFPWIGSGIVVLPWVGAAIALGLSLVAQFRVLLRLTAKLRHGADADEEDYVEVFRSEAEMSLDVYEEEWTPTPDVDAPFVSRDAAHHWYALHLFLRTALWRGVFWSCVLAALFWFPFAFSMAGESDTPHADFVSAVALALLTARFGWWWVEPGTHLPVSDWSQSLVYLRMALAGLAVACAVLWGVRLFGNYLDSVSFDVYALSPGLLLAGLWTGWCGLALAPSLVLGLGVALVWEFYGGVTSPLLVTINGLAWLLLLLGYLQAVSGRKIFPDLALPLTAMAGMLAGQAEMDEGLLPKPLGWCLRETLGAGLVLALLRHQVVMGILSRSAARRLRDSLLALVAASMLIALIWRPFHEPEQGVMAAYLAFGLVPPLFLPFVTVPHYMVWMRRRIESNRKARIKMGWPT